MYLKVHVKEFVSIRGQCIMWRLRNATDCFQCRVFLQVCLCYFRGPRLCWQGTFLLGHYAAMEAAVSGTFQSASETAEQKIAKRWRRKINTAAGSLKRIHRRSSAERFGLLVEPGGTGQRIVFEGSSCTARQRKRNKVDGRVGGRKQSGSSKSSQPIMKESRLQIFLV